MITFSLGVLLGDFFARMFWAHEIDRMLKEVLGK